MKSLNGLKVFAAIVCLLLGTCLFIAYYLLNLKVLSAILVYAVFVVLIVVIFVVVKARKKEDIDDILAKLNDSTKLALKEGDLGLLVYDKNYKITFMSDLFIENEIDHTGEKLLTWIPEIQSVVDGTNDRSVIVINDEKYEVSKKSDSYVLIFKDISKEYDLEKRIKDEAYVLGLCNFDNYDEVAESEDTITYVNANIKIPVMEYFKKHGIVYRTLRNNRLQLILNYQKYEELYKDRFSILNIVRREAKKADLDITLSMAFAYDYEDLAELDNETSNLLEIAQTRGGDQVVVRQYGKDAIFYGGSSEAREKQSKVKVRVMTNSIKQLIKDSDNIIIVGHSEADSDCIGSMLGVSCMVNALGKDNYVVCMSGEIEPMTKDVLSKYNKELSEDHKLVSENEAMNHLTDNSLVIMCDHHSLAQSNCQALLNQAKKIAIIDHHRRKADLDVDATYLYVEASASSTCEIISEFFAYIPRIEVSDVVANIMYLGIIIDTNHFRVRTGSRTFDAAKSLRNIGAEPTLVETLAQEPYINLKKRIDIINSAVRIYDDILLVCVEKGEYSRSLASQASDSMIQTKDIEAVFTICYTTNDESIITARSKGSINVQAILEKMNGGGHMTVAGLQRKNVLVTDLKNELLGVLEEYLANKEKQDESDIA
ncbi:MAG: DHH family phosphoesterase [Erysipelotrichaceae bacterium]|nr:DHH family phosphoesterase [Erysipelotrichaceae bacterium]